jgi:anti-sigma factor ChrR (cupin superfamily)
MLFTMDSLGDKGWEDAKGYCVGTKMKVLRDEGGAKTILLRLPKHFHMDSHTHINAEQHFVIDGNYSINNIPFNKGSYQLIPANEEHGKIFSEDGATILITWDPRKN